MREDLYKMGQPKEGEQDGADEEEGTEEPQVAKGDGLQGHEGQESAYGGDVTNDKGL